MADSQLLLQLVQDFSKRQAGRSFDESLGKMQEVGFFNPDMCEHGMSDLCLVLTGLAQCDGGLAVALFAHWAAAETLRCAHSDFKAQSLLAFPAFQSPAEFQNLLATERAGKVFLTAKIESVVAAGHPSYLVVAGYLVALAGAAVTLSKPIRTLGLRSCPHVDILMNQAPATRLGGAELFEQMSERMALAAAAIALGLAQGSLDEAVRYAKTRRQGGKEIYRWSEVKMLLGQMLVQLQTATLALSRACAAADASETGWQRNAAAVLISLQEMACALTSDGIQILGGAGYTTEFAQEQRFRDAHHTQHLLGLLPRRKLQLAERYLA